MKFDKYNNIQFITNSSQYINSGYYFINKKLIYKIKKKHLNFEKDFLVNIENKLLKGIKLHQSHNIFLDIGTQRFTFRRKIFTLLPY